MLKLFKWLAGVFITLILLIVVAAVVLPRIVDPNDYRDEITSLVKDKIGRDLRLDGDLTLEVFPWLGIRTQKLSLSQPEQIGGDMLSVQTAQLRVKLLPLLSKKVEVDTIILEQPELSLVTLKDGTDSFAGLGGDDATAEETPDAGGAAVALVVQGIELTNGAVTIDNRQTGELMQIIGLNLVTGNLIGTQLADINASGTLKSSTNPDLVEFKVAAQARIDTDTLAVTAKDISATVNQSEQVIDVTISQFDFDQNQQIDLQGVSVSLAGAQAIKAVVPSIVANLESQTATISDINVTSGDMAGTISNLKVSQFIDAPSASGRLVVTEFNAAGLIKEFDIDFTPADKQALNRVGLSADFSGSTDSAELTNLKLALDTSSLVGSGSVQNFENPNIKFDLSLDQLNLDSYLPESEEDEGAQDVSGSEALAVPMAMFKDVNANGRFKAQQLISGGLELNDVDVQIVSTPGNVTITPSANLYDGKLGGEIVFNEKADGAQLRVKNNIDLVDLGKVLNAADVSDQLSGIGTLAVDILVTEKDGVQSNEGTIKLFAKDGAIKGVDIKGIVDQGLAQYQKLKGGDSESSETGDSEEGDETKFAELLGTFYLKDFKLTNKDFSMQAPLFRLGGEGDIDLKAQTLDYLVNFAVVNSTSGQGGESLETLKGITLPIRLRGDLTSPSYSLDMKALYKGVAKKEIDEKKDAYLEEKFGIEGGGKLSTKDALKQILLKKVTKDDESASGKAKERPVQDVGANAVPVEDQQEQTEPEPAPKTKKQIKKEAKDELKKKLLEGLFN